MSTSVLLADFRGLHHRWGWFLAMGILLIALGTIALVYTPVATLGTVLILGWLMFFSGIVEAIHAFEARGWGGVLLHVAGGILGIIIGLLVITHPIAGAVVWTLLFASFLTVIGLFRLVAAIWLRYGSWGWAVFDGTVTLVLGLLLWAGMPWSGLWFLGLALGIALVLRGWSTLMFSFAVRAIDHGLALRPAA
ncbi:MAG: HdeD family acid-resistance protein [Acidobacteriaceae bacterium]